MVVINSGLISWVRIYWSLTIFGCLCACSAHKPASSHPIPSTISIGQSRPDTLNTLVQVGNSIYRQGSQRFDMQMHSILRNTVGVSITRVDSTRLLGVLSARYSVVPASENLLQGIIQIDSIRLSTTG